MKCAKLAALVIFSLALLVLHDSRLRAQAPPPDETFDAKVARLMADLKFGDRDARFASKNALIALGPKVLDFILPEAPPPVPPTPNPEEVAARMQEYEKLVQQLGAPEFDKREEAHKKLVAAGKEALPVLKKHADDPDPEIRIRLRQIMDAIENITPPAPGPPVPPRPPRDILPDLLEIASAIDPLKTRKAAPQLLESNSFIARFAASRLVCEGDDAQTVETLTKALDNDLLVIRSMALERLAQIGGESSADKILKTVDGANPILDKQAVECAVRLAGAKIKPALAELLNSKNSAARAVALYGLGLVKDAEHVAEMLDLARSPDMLLRLYGCRALAALGDKKFASPIIDAVLKGEIPLDYGPRVALLALASSDDAANIKKMFDSTDPQIRDLAILLAGKCLVPLDPDRLVEYALLAQCPNAAWTVGRLKYTQFTDELINASQDAESRVQPKPRLIQTIAMMAEKKHEQFLLNVLAGDVLAADAWHAAWALARVGDADTVDALIGLLELKNRNRFSIWLAICSLTGKKVDYNFLSRTEEEAKNGADSLRVWWAAARKDFKPARDMSYFPGAEMSPDQAKLLASSGTNLTPPSPESARAQAIIIMRDAFYEAGLPTRGPGTLAEPTLRNAAGNLIFLNSLSPIHFLEDVFRLTRDLSPAVANAEKFLKDEKYKEEVRQSILKALSLGQFIDADLQPLLSMLPDACAKIVLLAAAGDDVKTSDAYESALRFSRGGEADAAFIGRIFRNLSLSPRATPDTSFRTTLFKSETPPFDTAAWGTDVETFFPSDRVLLAIIDWQKTLRSYDVDIASNFARVRPWSAGRLNALLRKEGAIEPAHAIAGAFAACDVEYVRDFLASLNPNKGVYNFDLPSILLRCAPADIARCLSRLKPEVEKLDKTFREAIASRLLATFNNEGYEYVEKDLKMTVEDIALFSPQGAGKFVIYLNLRKNIVESGHDYTAQLLNNLGEIPLVPLLGKILREGSADEKLAVLRRIAVLEYGPVPRRGEEVRKQLCLKGFTDSSGPPVSFIRPTPYLPEILALLKNNDADVRAAAARALLVANNSAPRPLLFRAASRLLEDTNPEVRFVAVRLTYLDLLDVRPYEKLYYERLLKLLDDEDVYIRVSVLHKLSNTTLRATPPDLIGKKALPMLDGALQEERTAAIEACAAFYIPLSPARLSDIILKSDNWDETRAAFILLCQTKCAIEQKTLDKMKELFKADPNRAKSLAAECDDFANKDALLLIVGEPGDYSRAPLKKLALLSDPSLADFFEAALKNAGQRPPSGRGSFGGGPNPTVTIADIAASAVLGLVKLGKIEKKTALDWFFTGKDLPEKLTQYSLGLILPDICNETDLPLLIQWSQSADGHVSGPASAAMRKIRSARTLDSLVSSLEKIIADQQPQLSNWLANYRVLTSLALKPPKQFKRPPGIGPFGEGTAGGVSREDAAATTEEIKKWWAENSKLSYNAIVAKSLKEEWGLKGDFVDAFAEGKNVSTELISAIHALLEKNVIADTNFDSIPGLAQLLDELTGRFFSSDSFSQDMKSMFIKSSGTSAPELALARFRLWFLSNKDYMYWDNKAGHFEIAWDARAALVPLAVWRNIPEADRKNWDNLDQAARDKLIEDARKKS